MGKFENFEIDFSFTGSSGNYSDPMEFINEIKYHIIMVDEKENRELIGKGLLYILLLEKALSVDYNLYEIIDTNQSINEISDRILNIDDAYGIFDKIESLNPDDEPIFNSNIAILERIEILPKYRGHKISSKVIKRIVEQFYGWFDLIVLKAYPLQYDKTTFAIPSDWTALMNYSELKGDFNKSQNKLFELYRKMGFENPFGGEIFIARKEKILNL